MTERTQAIIAELEKAAEETTTLFTALSPAQLARPVYTESIEWNVRQVLAHLVTIEKSMHWLFRNLLDGGPGAPEDLISTASTAASPPNSIIWRWPK